MSDTTGTRARNLDVVRRFFGEMVNRKALEIAPELLAPDVAIHAGSILLLGRDEWETELKRIWSAFPDARVGINDLTADGERVAARMTLEGTQQGKFANVPPRLRKVSVPCAALIQLAQGVIQAIEFYFDSTAVLQQITEAYPGGYEGNGKSKQPFPKKK